MTPDEAVAALDGILSEATDLRAEATSVAALPDNPSVDLVLGALRAVRPALDRMEALLIRATRIEAVLERASHVARGRSDDAWDRAATKHRGMTRDLGPRHQYAFFNTEAFEERREDREAKDLWLHSRSVLESLRIMHKGTESLRFDLHLAVRAAQFESSLER